MNQNQKEILRDLVFEVAMPFLDILKNNAELTKKIEDNEIHYIKVVVKTILMISIRKNEFEKTIEYFSIEFAKLCLENIKMWREYFKLLKHIIQLYKVKNSIDFLDREKIEEITESILVKLEKNMQTYCNNKEEITPQKETQEFFDELEDDGFFDFDSEVCDEHINSMHYEDDKKVSAKEFLETSDIDDDLIDEIKMALDDYSDYYFEELNQEFIETVLFVLRKFYTSFSLHSDFKDLNISIEELIRLLVELSKKELSKEQQEMLRAMIDAIIEDLKKWYKVIFVEQTATDIHYLDASLLANIAQLKMFIKEL